MKLKCWISFFVVMLCTNGGLAQQFAPPANQNAALRYWMSFANLVDKPTDEATNKAIDDVLSGAAAWDEQKLGPILDANEAAVRSLQRATKLPACNWGLEYDRGFAMSLGHLPKARTIARLNALYGARELARGDAAGAVETWLAGMRFAQDVGKDISLIGTLSARPSFTANLHLLTHAVQEGRINADLKSKIRTQLQKLPPDGLDWTGSVRGEIWADEDSLHYLAKATDFAATFQEFFGHSEPAGAQPPTQQDFAAYRATMSEIISAFQLPAAQTKGRLEQIMPKVKNLSPVVQEVIPKYVRTNDARLQVIADKDALLQALK